MELSTPDKIKKHELFLFFFLSRRSFSLKSPTTPLSLTPPITIATANSASPSSSLPNGGRQSFPLFHQRTSSIITRYAIENKEIEKISYLRSNMKQSLDLDSIPRTLGTNGFSSMTATTILQVVTMEGFVVVTARMIPERWGVVGDHKGRRVREKAQ